MGELYLDKIDLSLGDAYPGARTFIGHDSCRTDGTVVVVMEKQLLTTGAIPERVQMATVDAELSCRRHPGVVCVSVSGRHA